MPDNEWMQARDNLMKEYPNFIPPLVPPPFPPPVANPHHGAINANNCDSQGYGTYNNAPALWYDQSNGNDRCATEPHITGYGEYDNRW